MPLYLYECATCELELEELHPMGQAPDTSLRCPLCGGWFARVIAPVQIGGRRTAPSILSGVDSPLPHDRDCLCCRPRLVNAR